MANQQQSMVDYVKDWLRSLMTLHRGHWEAARQYDKVNFRLGIIATITAAVSGTAVFSQLSEKTGEETTYIWIRIIIGVFVIASAIIVAIQTFYRSSELATRHKTAAVKYGQLRRELEEHLDLGLDKLKDREGFLTSFRINWNAVDEEAPPVPARFYKKAKAETDQRRT
ncbi:MAG: SLATT domain-containing protein [Spirochaetales bacterium]|nr:SLATT domain-containing protein [Spirochaetales bacterium]